MSCVFVCMFTRDVHIIALNDRNRDNTNKYIKYFNAIALLIVHLLLIYYIRFIRRRRRRRYAEEQNSRLKWWHMY